MKGVLDAYERQGNFQAPKDVSKAQNIVRTSAEMQKAFYDQNKAPAGVRRFTEPSEGDSIFNYYADLAKKTKKRLKMGATATTNFFNLENHYIHDLNDNVKRNLVRHFNKLQERLSILEAEKVYVEVDK